MGREVKTPRNELPPAVVEAAVNAAEARARDEKLQLIGAKETFARQRRGSLEEFVVAHPNSFIGVSAIGEMVAFQWCREQYLGQELTILSAQYSRPGNELNMEAEFLQGGGYEELTLLDYGIEVSETNIRCDGTERARRAHNLLTVLGDSLYLSDATCVVTEHSITLGYTPCSALQDEELAGILGGADMYVKRANIGGNRYLFAPFEVLPKG